MPLNFFYTTVQKSQKWPKTQIKGGGSCLKKKFLNFQVTQRGWMGLGFVNFFCLGILITFVCHQCAIRWNSRISVHGACVDLLLFASKHDSGLSEPEEKVAVWVRGFEFKIYGGLNQPYMYRSWCERNKKENWKIYRLRFSSSILQHLILRILFSPKTFSFFSGRN